MSSTSNPNSSAAPQKTIAILGAGITGLQTALSILTSSPSSASSPPPKVLVIAQHLPGDSSIEYTSPWAGGHWRSHVHASGGGEEEREVRDWDARTYAEWRRLLLASASASSSSSGGSGGGAGGREQPTTQDELERELGLGVRDSLLYWSVETDETAGGPDGDGDGLWWRHAVSAFRVLSRDDLARAAAAAAAAQRRGSSGDSAIVFGARYDTVCINVPRYLAYLLQRVAALGGDFVRAAVRTDGGLEGVVEDVQRIVRARAAPAAQPAAPAAARQDVAALVLATGLLSRRFLPAHEASLLYPVRGQTVLVRGEAPRAVTHILPGPEIAYVIPRPGSGTTILGGCKEVGNWNPEEDKQLTGKILERARGLVPELLTGTGSAGGIHGAGEFEVLSVQVGLRPGRRGGPRVEAEKERVRGVKVIYAYGHEGAGYQNSLGSAEKVVRLLAVE